jgi:hypothetical protein
MRTPLSALLAALVSMCAAAGAHAEPATVDSGTFIVYQGARAVGTETFSVVVDGDRLFMRSSVDQQVPTPDGDSKLEKTMELVATRFDFALKSYKSNQKFRDRELGRGVSVAETTLSVFREIDKKGVGNVLALPPGRLFLIDPMLFSLFEYMCLSLKDHTFDTRPISLLVLGPTDSLLEARVTDLGKESIRWGEKPVQARRLKIGDDRTTFEAWVGPTGGLLRLELPGQELRIERKAPPVKSRSRSNGSPGDG